MDDTRALRKRGGVPDAPPVGGRKSRATQTSGSSKTNERSTVTVPAPVLQALRDMAKGNGRQIVDEATRAVATWQYIQEQLNAGNRIWVHRPDGTRHELIFDLVRR